MNFRSLRWFKLIIKAKRAGLGHWAQNGPLNLSSGEAHSNFPLGLARPHPPWPNRPARLLSPGLPSGLLHFLARGPFPRPARPGVRLPGLAQPSPTPGLPASSPSSPPPLLHLARHPLDEKPLRSSSPSALAAAATTRVRATPSPCTSRREVRRTWPPYRRHCTSLRRTGALHARRRCLLRWRKAERQRLARGGATQAAKAKGQRRGIWLQSSERRTRATRTTRQGRGHGAIRPRDMAHPTARDQTAA